MWQNFPRQGKWLGWGDGKFAWQSSEFQWRERRLLRQHQQLVQELGELCQVEEEEEVGKTRRHRQAAMRGLEIQIAVAAKKRKRSPGKLFTVRLHSITWSNPPKVSALLGRAGGSLLPPTELTDLATLEALMAAVSQDSGLNFSSRSLISCKKTPNISVNSINNCQFWFLKKYYHLIIFDRSINNIILFLLEFFEHLIGKSDLPISRITSINKMLKHS